MEFHKRLMVLFSCIIIASGIVLSYNVYTSSIELITQSLGNQAKHIAKTVSQEMDLNEFKKVVEKTRRMTDKENELPPILSMQEYQHIREQLWQIKKIYGIKFLYTIIRTTDGKNRYVIDGFPLDYQGNDLSMPGDIETHSYEQMESAFATKQIYMGELTYDNKWGAHISSYFPLVANDGELIGILGADLDATDTYHLIADFRLNIIVFTVIVLAIVVALSYLLSKIWVASMIKKLEALQKEDDTPVWVSKLFLQISEKERRQLSSDLHDEVLQEVIHIKRSCERIHLEEADPKDKLDQMMEPFNEGLDRIVDAIRETCNELMPSLLTEQGIVNSIQALVEKVRLRADFDIHFHIGAFDKKLNDEEAIAVYRAVQELLHNAMKHSQATSLELFIEQKESQVIVSYHDNGVGMNVTEEKEHTKHLGLFGISERMNLLQGRFDMVSSKGHGVTAICKIPIKAYL